MTFVLKVLRDALSGNVSSSAPVAEYRLVCSGELYNSHVVTLDYRKTAAARRLLLGPIDMSVCSYQYDDYPQELALSFSVDYATDRSGSSSITYCPDDAVANDLAALMTLYVRRLVAVAGKIRTRWAEGIPGSADGREDWPEPVVGQLRTRHWKKRLASVITGPSGVQIEDHRPPAVAIAPPDLVEFLSRVVDLDVSEAYIAAARKYALAMELIEDRPGDAYQLFIQSVEAVASAHYRDQTPARDVVLGTKRNVRVLALKMGLTESAADELALASTEGMTWVGWKFRLFLQTYASDDVCAQDDLFHVPEMFLPTQESMEKSVKLVYGLRGRDLHEGQGFPHSAGFISGPMIPAMAAHELLAGSARVPPVTWFERVVSSALLGFLRAAGTK